MGYSDVIVVHVRVASRDESLPIRSRHLLFIVTAHWDARSVGNMSYSYVSSKDISGRIVTLSNPESSKWRAILQVAVAIAS